MILNNFDKVFSRGVGQRIRTSRERRNVSQENLARSLLPPRKPRYIRNIEAGLSSIPVCELSRIGSVLDVPVCYLIGDDALSSWIKDERFIEAYFQLPEKSRDKVRDLVFHLNGDKPILHR